VKVFSGLPRSFRRSSPVVAIGVFDGVHFAHRRILESAAKKAGASGGTSVALTFYPHPQSQKSLYSLAHRIKLIAECGIDVCVVLDFSSAFSALTAEEFLKDIIYTRLNARHVYVGDNFRFGRGAAGGVGLLRAFGRKLGFGVRVFPRMRCGGRPVSSTLIREFILAGKLNEAERMLGRPVSVYGTVIKGDRFGRRIGFPTANIDPHHEILPPAGVYSVNVLPDIPGRSRPLNGLCYIGRRPTLGKGSERRIEVYIFDCARDLYGHNLSINFLRMMRRDRKFPSVAALKEQIAKDAEKAKSFFRGKLNIETGSGYRVNCSGKSKKNRGAGSRNKRSLIRSSSEVTR